MKELIREEIKPPIERALAHETHEHCPIAVTDVQTAEERTFVVLKDEPDTIDGQIELAWANYRPCIKMAKAILAIEEDPDCAVEISSIVGRSEGRVAVQTSRLEELSAPLRVLIQSTFAKQR